MRNGLAERKCTDRKVEMICDFAVCGTPYAGKHKNLVECKTRGIPTVIVKEFEKNVFHPDHEEDITMEELKDADICKVKTKGERTIPILHQPHGSYPDNNYCQAFSASSEHWF